MTVKETNKQQPKCLICPNSIDMPEVFICLQCKNQCLPKYDVEIKSDCCNSNVDVISRITCSEKCHNKFIELMERQYGKVKKVTDIETGISHAVPIRDIIEKGLNHEDLLKYPVYQNREVYDDKVYN